MSSSNTVDQHSPTPIPTKIKAALQRIEAIDVLRGLIMVVMALDHTREYFGPTPMRAEDVAQTTVPLFFTRWITHFCAPLFLFLSGVSAYLYQQKHSRKKASVFLLSRGLWLIVLELVLFNFILQWGFPMIVLSIIWVIGWSMVLLSLLLWLPKKVLAGLAIAFIVLQHLVPSTYAVNLSNALPALFHHAPFLIMLGKLPVLVAYTIAVWAAVMSLGYAVGGWITKQENGRSRLWVGVTLLVVFLLLRFLNVYGDTGSWQVQERGQLYTVLSFLNVNKYPPSLLFLLLTLGAGFCAWQLFANRSNRLTQFFAVYGKVPFFYFLLHFAVISAGSYLWTATSFGKAVNLGFASPKDLPQGYEPSLWRVYGVWLLVVLLLYYPCKWYGQLKRSKGWWWLSYL